MGVVAEHVRADDRFTKCLSIGPVSKVMNMIVAWHLDGPQSDYFRQHVDRLADYVWMGSDGMRMNGTNGSQLWDTAFMVQAFLESGLGEEEQYRASLQKTLAFLDLTQVFFFFSPFFFYFLLTSCSIDQGQRSRARKVLSAHLQGRVPVLDARLRLDRGRLHRQGLKAVLYLQSLGGIVPLIPKERLFDCVNVLLSMQNADGGYGSYEATRGPAWIEALNPSEVFSDIMIEYSYVELTSAALQGIKLFQKQYPDHRKDEIEYVHCRLLNSNYFFFCSAIVPKAMNYIKDQQRADGSWYAQFSVLFALRV